MPDNILVRRTVLQGKDEPKREITQVVSPASLVDCTLYLIRDSPEAGHPGKERCLNQSRLSYYWPRMRLDIHEHIHVCQPCADHNPVPLRKAPILSYLVPSAPWGAVAIDISKLPRTEDGKEYLLVIMDNLSRFCILVPLPDKSAKTVARAIVDELICKFTSPKSFLSDNGGEFSNTVLEEMCKFFNIKECNMTPYHPASNGLAERQNRKVLNSLRHMITPISNSWNEFMPMVASTLNSSVNKSTTEIAFFIIYGTDKRLPHSVLTEHPKPVYNHDDFVRTRLHDLQKIHQYVQIYLAASKEEMLEQQHKTAKNIYLEIGDIVFEINQTRESQLDKRYYSLTADYR